MADTLTYIKRTAYEEFTTRLGAFDPLWRRLAGPALTNDTATLQRSDLYGVTAWATQVASPSAQNLSTGRSSTSSVAYEKVLQNTFKELRDNPEIIGEKAAQLAETADWTAANLFFTTATALDATAHPMDGIGYTATGGGTTYFVDSFATPVSQSNLLTVALSPSALSTARQRLREYKNKAGIPLNRMFSNSDMILVVPAALETTARDITMQPGQIYDGTGLVSGSFQGIEVLTLPYEYDANDWGIWLRGVAPVKMWLRKLPTIRVVDSVTSNHVNFIGEMEAAVVLEPFEGGVVWSVVT